MCGVGDGAFPFMNEAINNELSAIIRLTYCLTINFIIAIILSTNSVDNFVD